ncbi:MAG: AmmeMemoRadiSam system protein A, partial [Chloroflexota bacterium]|nr:AmmeMemoRadiSam system protein A [Chloroflexota bacterium]
ELRIVPIVFREPSLENARVLSDALVKALAGKKALIVASTDLSHYPPYDEALKVDAATLAAIESMDPQRLLDTADEYMRKGIPNLVTCFCSRGAVLTAMLTAPKLGASQVTVLKYANSGDTPFGDRRQVVGYGAMMFWRGEGSSSSFAMPALESPSELAPLNPDERERLLDIARRTITQFLETDTVPTLTITEPGLLQQRGAFVTLKKHGQLRGCIGRLIADGPLYLTVQKMAIEAAVADPRFPPVTPDELPDIEIEISVLSPLEPVKDVSQIEVGKHGLLIVKGRNQGVLLPQVATEQGWDREEFLRGVCRKAELAEDAWKEVDLYIFTAEVFGEKR